MENKKMIDALREELAKLRAERKALDAEYERLDVKCVHYSKETVFPMENGIGNLTDAQCDEIYEHLEKLVAELDEVKDKLDSIDMQIADLKRFSRWYIDELTREE